MGRKELIPGGLAEGKDPSDYDPKQLEMGIKVELEHTDDEDVAREIAMDHLQEIPDYYDRLKIMEEEAEAEMKKKSSVRDEDYIIEHVQNVPDYDYYDRLKIMGKEAEAWRQRRSSVENDYAYFKMAGSHRKRLEEFFSTEDKITDPMVHDLAEELGVSHDELEGEIYGMLQGFLRPKTAASLSGPLRALWTRCVNAIESSGFIMEDKTETMDKKTGDHIRFLKSYFSGSEPLNMGESYFNVEITISAWKEEPSSFHWQVRIDAPPEITYSDLKRNAIRKEVSKAYGNSVIVYGQPLPSFDAFLADVKGRLLPLCKKLGWFFAESLEEASMMGESMYD